MINTIRNKVKETKPLIHCITNPISIYQCANAILAVGARPMMAEHPREVREITESADALLLNLGNITNVRMESMILAAKAAKQKGIPIVLDAVGVACSALRREFAAELLKLVTPTVIKGNYSEINALFYEEYRSAGVDADASLEPDSVSRTSVALAEAKQTVILASGKTDIITDGKRLVYGHNGTPQLATVTGTGCMLGALCATYLSAYESKEGVQNAKGAEPDKLLELKSVKTSERESSETLNVDKIQKLHEKKVSAIDSAITACAVLGICGELAKTEAGSGSFMMRLMDALSMLKDTELEAYLRTEEREIEKV